MAVSSEFAGLGEVSLKAGKPDDAKPQLNRALQICISCLGRIHPETTRVASCVASMQEKIALWREQD